jgi:hypothetical protein
MTGRSSRIRFTGEHGLIYRYRDYECSGWTCTILVKSPLGGKLSNSQARAEAARVFREAATRRGGRL